jgi:hypothetical protein
MDITAPVFDTPPIAASYECFDDVPVPGLLGWTDNCDGTGTVLGTDVSDGLSCPETITRTWSYTDDCGNPASVSQTITVDDGINPDLYCPADITIPCTTIPDHYENYEAFLAAGGYATDNCGLNYDSFEWVSDVPSGSSIIRSYKILDNCANEAICEQTITIDDINVVTWVYLEGAAISVGGTQTYSLPMRTNLNTLKVLPGQTYYSFFYGNVYSPPGQPYSGAPWFYSGNEGVGYDSYGNPTPGTANYPSTVVDWILVSLRETPDGLPVCMKAALLHKDGHVEFVNGGFTCCDLEYNGNYYLVIEHRNHLIIMSPEPVAVVNGTLTYDFRYTQSYIDDPSGFGGLGQKELLPNLPGVYGMFAGNGDQVKEPSDLEGDILQMNFNDRTYWEIQNGTNGRYRNGDYNLNGDCNYNDRTTWEYNNGKFTTVPRN